MDEHHERNRAATLILRMWREGGKDAPWRCSVEDPRSKQRRGFSTLAELLPFLQGLTVSTGSGAEPSVRSDALGGEPEA